MPEIRLKSESRIVRANNHIGVSSLSLNSKASRYEMKHITLSLIRESHKNQRIRFYFGSAQARGVTIILLPSASSAHIRPERVKKKHVGLPLTSLSTYQTLEHMGKSSVTQLGIVGYRWSEFGVVTRSMKKEICRCHSFSKCRLIAYLKNR